GHVTGVQTCALPIWLPPSVTVRVMVAVPVCPAVGVTVTVRPVPEPPMVTFPFGMSAGFDDWTLTTRLPAAVSASPTVNPTGPTEIGSAAGRANVEIW